MDGQYLQELKTYSVFCHEKHQIPGYITYFFRTAIFGQDFMYYTLYFFNYAMHLTHHNEYNHIYIAAPSSHVRLFYYRMNIRDWAGALITGLQSCPLHSLNEGGGEKTGFSRPEQGEKYS
jgi:hypothetical protein